jgi:hypothetical protein
VSTPRLGDKYHNLGFELSKEDDTSLILKYKGTIICIIGSQLNLKDEMLIRICDSYLENIYK